VLRKTTRACTLPRAIAVAMAAKLTGLVVWIVLSVFVMNAIASLRQAGRGDGRGNPDVRYSPRRKL
jgi:hypothetical protein